MREVLARPIAKVPALRGRQVTILFYEASTRTRVSFEVAARNLSADVVNIAAASSSVSKGESLVDTVRTVEALGAQMLVVRHSVSGAPYLAAEVFGGSVLNGGDGWHAHPTQALLDLYTMRERMRDAHGAQRPAGGTVGGLLAGRKVVILGDILHSRVARSNIWTLTAAGADLWLCGPPTLLRGFEAWAGRSAAAGRRFQVSTSIDEALRDADVVMALRIQRERMAAGLLPSLREYAARYGLTRERLALARPGALVMHPGPMNEGVEIAPDVAAGVQSVITDQVTNGVAVRMAILYLLAGTQAPA
jgi:aspartate carbamoyltransferase catalytic subunit